mmetsp:Transcript_10296/g.25884  ORF Transcript_10296/g.25884 Transcript_10296/m.25884 type:complete len:218 (-) Transcript_10296:387-1040(-)
MLERSYRRLEGRKVLGLGLGEHHPRRTTVRLAEETLLLHQRRCGSVRVRVGLLPVLQRITGDDDVAVGTLQHQNALWQLGGGEGEELAGGQRQRVGPELTVGAHALSVGHAGQRPEGRVVAFDVEGIVAAVQRADLHQVLHLAKRLQLRKSLVAEAHRVDERELVALAHHHHVAAKGPGCAEELAYVGALHNENVLEGLLNGTVCHSCGKCGTHLDC